MNRSDSQIRVADLRGLVGSRSTRWWLSWLNHHGFEVSSNLDSEPTVDRVKLLSNFLANGGFPRSNSSRSLYTTVESLTPDEVRQLSGVSPRSIRRDRDNGLLNFDVVNETYPFVEGLMYCAVRGRLKPSKWGSFRKEYLPVLQSSGERTLEFCFLSRFPNMGRSQSSLGLLLVEEGEKDVPPEQLGRGEVLMDTPQISQRVMDALARSLDEYGL